MLAPSDNDKHDHANKVDECGSQQGTAGHDQTVATGSFTLRAKGGDMQNIGTFLTRRAFLSPALEATVEPMGGGRRLTFTDLNERSNRVANALRLLGVKKGDRVGLLLMNGAEFVETFFAVAKIGAVNVPLNFRLVADELEFILKDSGVTVLISSADFAALTGELHGRGDRTEVKHWVQVGGEPAAHAASYDAWIGNASPVEPAPAGGDDDLVFIMYTSGTTGLPKGVMHSHSTVMWAILTIAATADQHYADRYLFSLPMFHVGALAPALGCVYRGVTLVILKQFDPKLSWQLIEQEKITSTLMVPAMLQFMMATYDPAAQDMSSLRWVMSGAAPVPVTLIKAYEAMGVEIHQVYGLTETGGPACLILGEDALTHAGSTGRAFFHTDVRVVDEEGRNVAVGEPGEVIVRGPHIMVGYWNRPDATDDAIRDGWLHTGDIATIDDDGFVTIMDRVKDMLISGGENVYPAEIENVVLSHPGVADVAVIGIPSAKWGESPMAIVVRKDESLTADEVMEWCKGKVAPFKLVKAVAFVTEIPRNPSGKILKRILREEHKVSAPD
jgi:acyl-CoA synthetase (AMP-forming)/AMP-acid ligase II